MDHDRHDELKLVGRLVSHYRILEPLGKGGMGVVYLAQEGRANVYEAQVKFSEAEQTLLKAISLRPSPPRMILSK